MRNSAENVQIFVNRRAEVAKKISKSALIIAAHPEQIRNHDVGHPYRQDSNFYYMTGFEEPDSFFIFRPGCNPESVMFVRKKDIERETWDGFRFGPEAAQSIFKMDAVYPIEDFEKVAPQLLTEVKSVYYRILKNSEADKKVFEAIDSSRRIKTRTNSGLLSIHDADLLLGEFRLIKKDSEILNQKRACEISAQAHLEIMKSVKPGMNERQIQGLLNYHFLNLGAAREGYNYIVASGNNATTLHYNFNDQVCKSGDLLLIDAGAEYNYFTGDITRTFPINGQFTESQARLYSEVLKVQKEIIQFIKPGVFFKDLHEMANNLLTDALCELGFFVGRKEDIISSNQFRKYYPHGIGHWLGMDVHDAGMYFIDKEPRAIEEGMCFTIEPGIYVPENDHSAPLEYRGIGIRIEDNLLVTKNGTENLTDSVPKEIDEIEKVMKN